jgi:pimeloyl-ACP methyl ester carboxylesterase
MPLLDHFHPPLHPHHHWESFHSNWATRIAPALFVLCLVLALSGCSRSEDNPQPAGSPSEIQEVPVQLPTKSGTLHGTLDLPRGKGPFPVVLIIAGSGPTDRDGNQPVIKNDSLKKLGRALADRGIAVLRCDKRGVGKSLWPGLKETDLRFDTYVDDAVAWIRWLRQDSRFSRAGVVGHSEGSLIGMLAAPKAGADAFVSVAGAGRDAPTVLREQLAKNLPPALKAKSDHILTELEAGRTVADIPTELATLFRPSVQPYLISWFKHHPDRILAGLKLPVLIVQGTTDIQVGVADARRLAAAKPDAQLHIIEGMNHVLKHASTPQEQQEAYTDPSKPLVPEVVDRIAGFLGKALAARP